MKKLTILLLFAVFLVLCTCNTQPKPQPVLFEPNPRSPSVQIGEAEIQFNRAFPLPGIRKINVIVSYYPQDDAVCLRWRMDMHTYHQFWNSEGREEFIKCLALYKEDFNAQAFGKSSRRTKRQYGTSNGYISWQMTSITVRARAAAIVDFGYFFVDNSPYFVANQRRVEYEDAISRDSNRTLVEMPMYFTRAQADVIAAFFDPEFIASIDTSSTAVRSAGVDFEDY